MSVINERADDYAGKRGFRCARSIGTAKVRTAPAGVCQADDDIAAFQFETDINGYFIESRFAGGIAGLLRVKCNAAGSIYDAAESVCLHFRNEMIANHHRSNGIDHKTMRIITCRCGQIIRTVSNLQTGVV